MTLIGRELCCKSCERKRELRELRVCLQELKKCAHPKLDDVQTYERKPVTIMHAANDMIDDNDRSLFFILIN